jgi:hypothetical protein
MPVAICLTSNVVVKQIASHCIYPTINSPFAIIHPIFLTKNSYIKEGRRRHSLLSVSNTTFSLQCSFVLLAAQQTSD